MAAVLKVIDRQLGQGAGEAFQLRLASEMLTARELIRRRVAEEVALVDEQGTHTRLAQERARSFLIRFNCDPIKEIPNAPNRPRPPARLDEAEEIAAAIKGFEAKTFVMLFDHQQIEDLDEELIVTPGSEVVFLRDPSGRRTMALDELEAALAKAPTPSFSEEARGLLDNICRQAVAKRKADATDWQFSDLPAWASLKTSPRELQAELAVLGLTRSEERDSTGFFERDVCWSVAQSLLRKILPFKEEHIAELIYAAANRNYLEFGFGLPLNTFLKAAERHCEEKAAQGELRRALKTLKLRVDVLALDGRTQFLSKTENRIVALLDPDRTKAAFSLPLGEWTESIRPWLDGLPDKKREAWIALLAFAATCAQQKSKPTKSWLAEAKPLITAVGKPAVAAQIDHWLASTKPDPKHFDVSLDVLKGLIWASVYLDHAAAAPILSRFADVCYRKVPGVGARSVKLGNACITALSMMKGSDAALAELVQMKARIKYGSAQDLLSVRLDELADERGTTVADLEESALPDFGLDGEGQREVPLGNARATIVLGSDGATLQWRGSDGKSRKAPPAAVKRAFSEGVKALKQEVKDLDAALGAQSKRLEAAWIEDRSWTVELWRTCYLEHPLRKPLSSGLIWRIDDGGRMVDVMPTEKGLTTSDGTLVSPPDDATVRLWHPLDSNPDDVLAWRHRIMREGLTQPIKQAHREVYALTDAECRTGTYSNRFAAHILRQHQFRALCQARGWRYDFQGYWDGDSIPSRHVPQHGLTVEYHVDPVENDERSEADVYLYISTDQVRFVDADAEPVPLERIPPILFSELMRDVDLFVAVTSVANDPDWEDGGPEGRHSDYWRAHAFGDLSQTAQTRRDLLAELVPKLAIGDKLKVTDKYLEVQGTRGAYRIHLGSGNIQILPGNRYLCIVLGKTPKASPGVTLPFTGDTLLSIILSKAFMLAEDDKITDETILSQLGH